MKKSEGMPLKGDRSCCLCLIFHFSSLKCTLGASDKSCKAMVSVQPITEGHHQPLEQDIQEIWGLLSLDKWNIAG